MGSVRRWAVLSVLLLLIAAMAAVSMPRASAYTALDPVPGPVKMNYACALKPHGMLRYVSTPKECDYKGKNPGATLVTIAPGPHYACVRFNNSVFLVASLRDCPVPMNRAALTLPPTAKPVYFCALKVSDLLSYTTDPRQCSLMAHLSVVVPVQGPPHLQPPVLATIESAAYSTLFALIGTTYGGDGVTTFALPDLRGRVPSHQGGGFVIGQQGGVEQVTLTGSQLPAHSHPFNCSLSSGAQSSPAGNVPGTLADAASAYIQGSPTVALAAQSIGAASGGSQPHDNMQPYLGLTFIISLFGIFPSQG